jgi:hypothetical protein
VDRVGLPAVVLLRGIVLDVGAGSAAEPIGRRIHRGRKDLRNVREGFRMRFALGAPVLLFLSAPLYAQPSGGPYGPIQQTYEIPQATHVYYVAPDGRADAPGTTLAQPTTLEAAIAQEA